MQKTLRNPGWFAYQFTIASHTYDHKKVPEIKVKWKYLSVVLLYQKYLGIKGHSTSSTFWNIWLKPYLAVRQYFLLSIAFKNNFFMKIRV